MQKKAATALKGLKQKKAASKGLQKRQKKTANDRIKTKYVRIGFSSAEEEVIICNIHA